MPAAEAIDRYAAFLTLLLTYPELVNLVGTYHAIRTTPLRARIVRQRAWLRRYPSRQTAAVEELYAVVNRLFGFDPREIGLVVERVRLRVERVVVPFQLEVNEDMRAGRRGGEAVVPFHVRREERGGAFAGGVEIGGGVGVERQAQGARC